MIELSQHTLAGLLVKAFLFGVASGVLCDVIRLLRMLCGAYFGVSGSSIPKKIFSYAVTFIFDVIFWIVVGISSVILMYSVGGGVFRGMTYIGMAFGFLVYYLSISRLTAELTKKLILLLRKLLLKLASLMAVPIKALWRAIIFLYHLTIGKIVGKIREGIKLRQEKRKLAKEACEEPCEDDSAEGGKEAFVYVSENCRYRREGRIRF